MQYTKVPFSSTQLISKLEQSGLSFKDKNQAIKTLDTTSYYRLASYLIPFKIGKKIISNTFFEDVVELYNFDSELRSLVTLAIEKIEVTTRAIIVNTYSLKYGSHWYSNSAYFRDAIFHSDFLDRLEESIKKSKEPFIEHYLRTYSSPLLPPCWMVFETITFGTLSNLYKQLNRDTIKKATAKRILGIPNPILLESWLHTFSYIRNLCAHHSRLWNRVLHVKPFVLSERRLPKKYNWINTTNISIDRLYLTISSIYYILERIDPNNTFDTQLKTLLNKYSSINTAKMGFPSDWQQQPLWKSYKSTFNLE